jgi:hypothetical protein
MQRTFLFRFDMARENDEFLDRALSQGHIVYAGIAMKLKQGWIPDFLEVSLDDNPTACTLTMFELESTEIAARISARKYLPESSAEILETFRRYLQQVLRRCRSTADPRSEDIRQLDDYLGRSAHTTIWTAGALRHPAETIERLPLIDQGVAQPKSAIHSRAHNQTHSLRGEVLLSSREHKTLSRTILILDAVMRGWDKSDTSLRIFRDLHSQRLRKCVQDNRSDFPTLCELLCGQKTGVRVVIEDATRELCVIWNQFQSGSHSESTILSALERFLPIDRELDPNAPVRIAFEKARLALNDSVERSVGVDVEPNAAHS